MVKVIRVEGFDLFIVITLVSFANIRSIARPEKVAGEAQLATTVPSALKGYLHGNIDVC